MVCVAEGACQYFAFNTATSMCTLLQSKVATTRVNLVTSGAQGSVQC